MADPDSEEEDTFVTIGTPLEVYDEDEVPKKAAIHQEQVVRDKQGRVRFHGAFTGGFSAGYFNTVGSKEGFTPSTFVSSKNKRADNSTNRPESFMDEEDMDQFGINPLTLATTDSFTTTRTAKRPATSSGSLIPGDLAALTALILPAKLPIGVKLLRSLGWKEGQGIGPRVKRKVKVKSRSNTGRVYGCALPGQGSEGSSSEDEYAQGLTFAPKDVNPINFTPKANTRGIGYSGIDPSRVFGPTQGLVDMFEKPAITKTGRKGITGQAFGVGALEEDDDDVYGAGTSMSNYDRELFDEHDHLHGWTAPGANKNNKKQSRFSNRDMRYVGRVLDGFALTSTTQQPAVMHRPPRVPRGYRPVHMFDLSEIHKVNQLQEERSKMDAATRSAMLGDIQSVFDLVSKSDKDKMAAAKAQPPHPENTASNQEPAPSHVTSAPTPTDPVTAVRTGNDTRPQDGETQREDVAAAVAAVTAPVSLPGSPNFKPFAKEPQKQLRYEAYLEAKKQGSRAGLERLQETMTEWEREREEAEFLRAEQLYKPMSLLMASRFQRAQYSDDAKDIKLQDNKKVLSDAEQAASCKMYGKLTREAYEWHPHRTVCKRFNIRNPYPDSTIVGLPSTRRDKYSVFDFLTVRAAPTPPPPPPEPSLADVAAAKNKKNKPGPLAILNKPFQPAPVRDTELAPSSPSSAPRDDEQEAAPPAAATNSAAQPTAVPALTTDRPPADIFKAIFDSSDSDSDTSDGADSDNDKTPDATETVGTDTPPHSGPTTTPDTSHDTPDVTSLPSHRVLMSSHDGNSAAVRGDDAAARGTQGTSSTERPGVTRTADGRRGIFDMLNTQIKQEMKQEPVELTDGRLRDPGTPPGTPPGGSTDVGQAAFYGPRPPPAATCGLQIKTESSSDSRKKHKKDRKWDRSKSREERRRDRRRDSRSRSRSRGRTDRDRERSQDRDRKDKSRDKSRDKSHDKSQDKSRDKSRDKSPDGDRKKSSKSKDKKKKKKSKHKKHKQKSKKKSKKSKTASSDSEDADSESSSESDDTDAPSSAVILQRLMMLKKKS